MKKKLRVAFDLDGIFINHPPLIPRRLIERLYKKNNSHLSYRLPGTIEKRIRILSHHYLLRPPIKNNIAALYDISKLNNIETYIISSRFSFLKSRTEDWNKKNNIGRFFKKMFFNFGDEQPHVFKERIIRNEEIDKFIDDDLDLLLYLSGRNPKVRFYWINPGSSKAMLPTDVKHIHNLAEFRKNYL